MGVPFLHCNMQLCCLHISRNGTVNIPNMGNVTASKATFCYFTTFFSRVDSYSGAEGNKDMASFWYKQFNTIYNALDGIGFLDNVKE